jgi:hypothetical protein
VLRSLPHLSIQIGAEVTLFEQQRVRGAPFLLSDERNYKSAQPQSTYSQDSGVVAAKQTFSTIVRTLIES